MVNIMLKTGSFVMFLCCMIMLDRFCEGQDEDRYASFGILSDSRVSPEFVKVALSEVWQENQSIFPDDNETNFPSVLRVVDDGFSVIDITDPNDVLRKVCAMLTSSPAFVLFLTNCNGDESGIPFLASALRLPVLWIGAIPGYQCRKRNQDQALSSSNSIGNPYFIEAPIQPSATPRKKRRTVSFNGGSNFGKNSINEHKMFWEVDDQMLVGKFFASFQWSRLVCLYDFSFDFSSFQNVLENLGNRMQRVIVQKLPMNPINGQFIAKLSGNLIKDIIDDVDCPDSSSSKSKIIFVIFCSERTTKKIIIDLLPFFHNKRVHFYIVDIGWKKNFLNGVLYSREFTIITKREKQTSRQSLSYNENLKYLKDQFKYTLRAVSKVVINDAPPDLMTDLNMTCAEGQFYPELESNEFVTAIRNELGVMNDFENGTFLIHNNSFDSTKENVETYLNTDVLPAPKLSRKDTFQDISGELELRGLSANGQIEFRSLKAAISENEKLWTDETDFDSPGQPTNNSFKQNYDPYQLLVGRTLRVATIEDPPFVMMKRDKHDVEFYGFSVSVLDSLANRIGFKYVMYEVEDKKYGSIVNRSWNGLVGELVSKKADIAISAMTISPRMEKYIDFTARYMDFGLGVLMKKQELDKISLFTFLRPFHNMVWYCILGAWFSVSVLLFVLNRVTLEPRKYKEGRLHHISLRDTFWSVYSTLLQQGPGMCDLSFSSQIVTGIWWIFVFVLFSSYLATLTSNLTLTRLTSDARSLFDLASQSNMNFGTVRDSSIYDSLITRSRTDDNPTWQGVWNVINETNSVSIVEDGINRVKEGKGNYAFVWDISVIKYIINSDPTCSLSSIQEFIFDKGYGIGVQKNDPIKDALSLGILELQEKGIIQTLKSRWWKSSSCSLQPNSSPSQSINLQRFSGLFCLLGGGMVFASLVAMCEICVNARRDRRSKTKAVYNEKDSEKGAPDTDPLLHQISSHPNVTFEKSGDDSIRIIINGMPKETKNKSLNFDARGGFQNSRHSIRSNGRNKFEDLPESKEEEEDQNETTDMNGSKRSNGYVVSVPSHFSKRKKFQKQKKTYSIS